MAEIAKETGVSNGKLFNTFESRVFSFELRAAAGIAFEDGLPSREIPSYRGQRHFPGLVVAYENWPA
jgi:hypothetical protein